jgi:hypothetical protein
MTERDPLADRQQPVGLRGSRGCRPDPEPLCCSPQRASSGTMEDGSIVAPS